ncbi:ATP-binding cassette, subfamily F, member 3 [Alteribacillus persepolensis]|uniref:ATP-binding cassette, subfamily F, member 3 n=1 Tax=Alteribacillus persepolensis TaxID=568899 RepID=A0A1G8J522_9BACI|nr:ATP-binding cassette domain-containing protein [Alteribacillus persepolensis]SDI26334.1 ATP-binding cassette, subfamily F, member 3 [Alteribacillus persepolensis]
MIALQCSNITKSFGAETILDNVKLEIKANERVALVGRNGAGKSTLLKIIAGKMTYDSGEIITPKGIQLGYLDQHTGLQSDRSIWEEMLTVFTKVQQMEKTIRRLEVKMADPNVYNDQKSYEKVLAEYDQLQHDFDEHGGYQYEADIRSVLAGLKFAEFDYHTPVSSLSGGQKTRLALGKLLLSKPELLVLDEPTNHLDIETLGWLENYLANYNGSVLIVSHDRYFLDKIVSKVYEVTRTKVHVFQGNYSYYLEEKANRYQQELKAFEKQQKEVAELEDFIQRNIVRASTSKRAQSRRKKLEKMERIEKPDGAEKSAKFSFDIERQSGNEVLHIDNVSVAYNDEQSIINNMNLSVKKQESIALIGPNGIGKSTLLKAIAGKIAPVQGSITFGSKVSLGYYDQEQADLHSNKDVLHELWDDYPLTPEKDIRTVLGNFLFSGDDVLKQVPELSGGEKSRLALAKLMMKQANFLIFDEPTNHLDLDSKEVLESALLDYPGTLLFVSHDRYFLNRMATKIVELSEDGPKEYLGDYDYYLMKKDEEEQRRQLHAQQQGQTAAQHSNDKQQDKQAYIQEKEAKKEARKRQRQIEKIEQEIEDLEQAIASLEEDMLQPEVYENHEKADSIQQQINDTKSSLEEKMNNWESLQLEET